MAVAFASTFLGSQEVHGLASTADAHLPQRERERGAKITFSKPWRGWGLCRCEAPLIDAKPKLGGQTRLLGRKNLAPRARPAVGLSPPGYSPGRGHRQCQAEPGEAEPRRCPGPGPPSCSLTVSHWLPGPPRADRGLSPAEAGSYPTGIVAAHRWHLWGVGRKASRVGRRSSRVPTNSGKTRFLHLPRGTRRVAATGAAPTAPKGITPSVGCLEAKWCSRLGPRSPKRLALPGIGGTAPVHAHSLSTSTRLTVPKPDVRGALSAVSWAELRQITIVCGKAALPTSWAELRREGGGYQSRCWAQSPGAQGRRAG